ncbi:hypothetical protein C5167_005237 [Papaver somniferum]|uniref:F-box associated domain-containing protein n=1 Tax=Papaver somniferum TaxID=3469 RepID=A0A4Y7J9V9_PAPSO|nr:hypothetical protein C5167_005237 [Papaver somniferum]
MSNCVFWNGPLHWIDIFGILFYFNVDQELRMEMKMPVYDKELHMEPKHFGECKGRLYLTFSPVHSPANFEIFEMKTDYTGWSKRYVVNLQQVLSVYPGFDEYSSKEFDVLLVREVEEESPKNMILKILTKIRFGHVYREVNFSADTHAKRGAGLGSGLVEAFDTRPTF